MAPNWKEAGLMNMIYGGKVSEKVFADVKLNFFTKIQPGF